MFEAFHFLRPEWLLTLPFIALILLLLNRRVKKNSGWETVCDAELLQFQLAQSGEPAKKPFRILHWTVPFLFFIGIIALAGPAWEKKEQPVFQQDNALVIILDLSLSMNAKDIKPSRLERAKLKLIDILKQKKEGQTALIAFAGDAHTVSPLTIDNKTIMSLLPALDSSIMPLAGSHLVDALNTAKQLFKNSGFTQGDILLITDGIEHSQQSQLKKSIKNLRKQGYYFSIIGVGSQTGSPIPLPDQGGFVKDLSGQVVLSKLSPEPLTVLAKLGNGQYHKLSLDDGDFKSLVDKNWHNDKPAVEQDDQFEQWHDAGIYLTLLLIPFALLSFRRGLLSIVLIMFLAPYLIMEPVYANEAAQQLWNERLSKKWNQLWTTADQQGQKAFNAQNYEKAADSFANENWKAGAQYRAGEFTRALEQYSKSTDAQSLYNKGNTLANMQKFPEAVEAYEQALKKQPEYENASKNLDYIKDLIAQQQKQQSDQKNSEQNKDKSDKQSENQQQDQKNSTDDASQGNETDSDEAEKNSSDESDSEGSESSKNDEKESASKAQEQDTQSEPEPDSSEPESDEAKSPEDYQQKNADKDESEQKPEEQAQAEAEPVTDKESEDEQQGENSTQSDVLSQLSQEEQQSLKQWLQRIPDNPGKLLKIKFRNNTLLKQRNSDTEAQYEGNPW